MSASLEIQIISILISVACSVVGVFLVLRQMSMITDSITHTVLLGIVLSYFVFKDLSSPFLIVGAAIMGVATVWFTETISKTKLVSQEASIGVVFPLFFSIAIILVTLFANSVHLDVDSVLLGELAFAPFDRFVVFGIDIGAKAIYVSLVLLVVNLVFIIVLYKELKLSTFDPMLALVLGFSPVLLHYIIMTLVSITAVGAFEAVGSVLVIAFMIGPPTTAYLLTNNLKSMILISAILALISSVLGYQIASVLDISISGSIAVVIGLLFIICYIFAPNQGLISVFIRKKRQRLEFGKVVIISYLNKSSIVIKDKADVIETVHSNIKLDNKMLKKIISQLTSEKKIEVVNKEIKITQIGIENYKLEINKIFS